ncbi:MAG: Uma2 family endonuclease [Anaerolineae bacterium]
MTTKPVPTEFEGPGEPAWEIATLFPAQGAWSEGDYLTLDTNRLIEYSAGRVEVLPMPTEKHQAIVAFLYMLLFALRQRVPGAVMFAPFPVRLWPGKFREPDLAFMLAAHADRRYNEYWSGADLVMEVVSGSAKDRQRDLVVKRAEYAQAGIPEYWSIDPEAESITVLRLADGAYIEHGQYGRGAVATSATLEGLQTPVDAVLDAASPH